MVAVFPKHQPEAAEPKKGAYVDVPLFGNPEPDTTKAAASADAKYPTQCLHPHRRSNGMKVRCGHFSMRENGKSIITGGENGFIRLVFEAYSNTIVGAQMMCPRATDMIGEIATAIANGLSAEEMSFAMRAQPTYNEGIGAAIEDAMRKK